MDQKLSKNINVRKLINKFQSLQQKFVNPNDSTNSNEKLQESTSSQDVDEASLNNTNSHVQKNSLSPKALDINSIVNQNKENSKQNKTIINCFPITHNSYNQNPQQNLDKSFIMADQAAQINKSQKHQLNKLNNNNIVQETSSFLYQGRENNNFNKNLISMGAGCAFNDLNLPPPPTSLLNNSKHDQTIGNDSNDLLLSPSKCIILTPSKTNTTAGLLTMNTITYKSKYFTLIIYILLSLTLLPLQYHNESFGIQIRKMQDSCANTFRHLNANQTAILEAIFPFGFSNVLSISNLENELKVVDRIHQTQTLNNLTLKFMSQKDCVAKNFTNVLNIITIQSATKKPPLMPIYHEEDEVGHENQLRLGQLKLINTKQNTFQTEQRTFQKFSNIILICDDESYKKSLMNSGGISSLLVEDEYRNSDVFDFQSNILTQWNISCRNLSNSIVSISYAQMTFLSGEIIGAIFFSMLADYIGRKKVFLATLYLSTIVGSLVSIVQTYKQYVIVRFPIAALTQVYFFKIN